MSVMRKSAAMAAMTCGIAVAGMGAASADAVAHGGAADSPGLVSGNSIQLPINVPVNLCGVTLDVVGALNPASDDKCINNVHVDHGHGKDGHGKDHCDCDAADDRS